MMSKSKEKDVRVRLSDGTHSSLNNDGHRVEADKQSLVTIPPTTTKHFPVTDEFHESRQENTPVRASEEKSSSNGSGTPSTDIRECDSTLEATNVEVDSMALGLKTPEGFSTEEKNTPVGVWQTLTLREGQGLNGTPSRYRREFNAEGATAIGRGSQGDLVKVMKWIDKKYYAVKMIVYDVAELDDDEKDVLLAAEREVHALVTLDAQQNVVRYYATYSEFVNAEDISNFTKDLDDQGDSSSLMNASYYAETGSEDYAETGLNTGSDTGTGMRLPNMYFVVFLQMELCEQNLCEFMNEGRSLTILQILQVMLMIVSGVEHCHDNDIMHRDLKPANILIKEGIVKLGDFGLAREFETNALTGSPDQKGKYSKFVGTRDYRSPEVAEGLPYGPSCDIFSVGLICAELCLEQQPMETDMEWYEAFETLRSGGFPEDWAIETTRPKLHNLLKDMLSHDASRRPTASQVIEQIVSLIKENTLVLIDPKKYGTSVRFVRIDSIKNGNITSKVEQKLLATFPELDIKASAHRSENQSTTAEFVLLNVSSSADLKKFCNELQDGDSGIKWAREIVPDEDVSTLLTPE